jgi:uncharacterized integral membrane protein
VTRTTLIISFALLLVLIIIGIQNTQSLEVQFLLWNISMSFTALFFYSAVLGAAIVSVLTLPKLMSKSLQVRKLNKTLSKKKDEIDKNLLSGGG